MAHLLLVDDEPLVLRAITRIVRPLGHSCETVTSADDALAAARARTPDCILLDYAMPELDGATLLGKLHALLGDRCPPVIFVTATPRERVEAALPPGAKVAFLAKPFTRAEIVHALEAALATPRVP